MNKSIITKILVISILLVLFSFSIRASIFATIGMKGLSFASPQSAKVVETVVCASNPASCAAGYLTQQVSGQLMQEVAKQSPEVAKSIEQYNQVKGWIDQGAKVTEDLKMTQDGQLAGGSITVSEKQQNLGKMTNNIIGDVKDAELSTKGENEPYNLKATKDGASVTIGKNTYSNLQKDSIITADRDGKIKEADMTFTGLTTVKVGEDEILANKGTRVVFKDGKYAIYDKDQAVQVNKEKIFINGENSIEYDKKKITGKDFTLDEKRFTGIGDKPAEVTLVDKGYLLGKNTIAEDDRITITSEKGNVLYSKMCEDTSGFSNYINPCKKTLAMQGEGFSAQLKEGKNFGLDVGKDDVLKYELKGGRVVLDNGEQTMTLAEGKSVIVTNGGVVTRYTKIGGVEQELIKPNSIGENLDVSVATKYGEIVNIANDKTGVETVYSCPSEDTGAVITGAVDLGALYKKGCEIVGINTGNSLIGKKWESETITEEEPLKSFERDGYVTYSKIIRTADPYGKEHAYSIASDGKIYEFNDEKLKWEEAWVANKQLLESFGVPQTKEITPKPEVPPETPAQKIQQITKPVEEKVLAFEKLGNQKWENDRKYMESNGEGDVYGVAIQSGGGMGWITSLPNGKGARSEPVEAITDDTGKVVRYEAVGSPQVYVPIGVGKVRLTSK